MRICTSPDTDAFPGLTQPDGRVGAPVAREQRGRQEAIHRPFLSILAALAAQVASAISRAEQRRHLAEMDHRMLRDIGITPFERDLETRKWWWRR